jgi:hypothetical protein
MKFFIVTCIKENQETVQKILRTANIRVYSSTDIMGFKDNQNPNLLEEWFAAGDEQCDSTMIFSFTANENAANAMNLIIDYNLQNKSDFPIRAFIVPVEKASF